MAFRTTRWSLVVAAGKRSPSALAVLLEAYWYPLYAFARRSGHDEHASADLVQGFFAVLLEKDYLRDADRERGRFRTFLLTSFRHHASKERARATAKKRGGGRTILSLDLPVGEERYRREARGPAEDPERLYERKWALEVLERAEQRVAAEHARPDRRALLDALRPFLAGGASAPAARQEAADRVGLSPAAFRVALHRLRGSMRDALRREIADTVADPREVDDEIRHLMEVVGG